MAVKKSAKRTARKSAVKKAAPRKAAVKKMARTKSVAAAKAKTKALVKKYPYARGSITGEANRALGLGTSIAVRLK